MGEMNLPPGGLAIRACARLLDASHLDGAPTDVQRDVWRDAAANGRRDVDRLRSLITTLESRIASAERERDEAMAKADGWRDAATQMEGQRNDAEKRLADAHEMLKRAHRLQHAAGDALATTEQLLRYFGVDPEAIDKRHALVWSKHTLILAELRSTLRAALKEGGGG